MVAFAGDKTNMMQKIRLVFKSVEKFMGITEENKFLHTYDLFLKDSEFKNPT